MPGLERLEGRLVMSSTWVQQGPGPIIFGGSVIPDDENPVAGAVEAIAVQTSDPTGNTVYVGTVNGGVWKTTDAYSPSPHWIPLTDSQFPTLSINSLAISPLDSNTIFAGSGKVSSIGDGASFGVGRSTDAGRTWCVLATATLAGKSIRSIVPTQAVVGGTGVKHQVVLVATSPGFVNTNADTSDGIYRSTDGGTTFRRISGDSVSGLPDASSSDLISDPANAKVFFAAVPNDDGGAGTEGIYVSSDSGATWTRSAGTGLAGALSGDDRILLTASPSGSGGGVALYAEVISLSTGGATGVFRSTDLGATWVSMGAPSPDVLAAGQGWIHGAIVAFPMDPTVVYIAGDADFQIYAGIAFRGVYSPAGTTWERVVGSGANNTAPHSDARSLAVDPLGNVLQGCDGGIYRLTTPNVAATRIWQSVNGNLVTAESQSAAYDPVSKVFISGTQDNGTVIQLSPGSLTWGRWEGGDGGYVAVDGDQAAHPGSSIRYASAQFLLGFHRSSWDADGNLLGYTFMDLNIVAGPGAGQNLLEYDPFVHFYNPYVLNNIDPSRMLIGTANIYESLDRGDSLTDLVTVDTTRSWIGDFVGYNPMDYGGRLNGVANPDVFYVGAGAKIYHRVTLGGPVTTLNSYPGDWVRALVMDPQNDQHIFVLDTASNVWGSFNEGRTWINMTANLPTLNNVGPDSGMRTIEIVSPSVPPLNPVLIVGGVGGVWQMRQHGAAWTSWTPVAAGLPHVLVNDLQYDYADNILTAGTVGRGVWSLSGFFHDGPELSAASLNGAAPDPGHLSLGIFIPPVARLGNLPGRKTSTGAAVVSLSGGSGVAINGSRSTGTQALTSMTSGSASQARSQVVSYPVAGRRPVNQAVDDTKHDSFGFPLSHFGEA